MPDHCRLLSPAKINLGLNILFRREDGFHELETVLVALDLYDELEFVRTSSGGVRIELTSTDALSHAVASFPLNDENLIVKAVRAIEQATGIRSNLRITIRKKIPIAAGLGGGSSNAAATLTAMRHLYDIEISDEQLLDIAGALGSDVPFFLNGPSAVASGRGEIIRPVSIFTNWWAILISPSFHLSTADVYKQLNLTSLGRKNSFELCGDEEGFFAALRQCHNDLEEVAVACHPVLFAYMQRLRELGAVGAFVTGSGPTVVGVFRKCPDSGTVTTLQTELTTVRVLITQPVSTPSALTVQ